jgi:hypothetical protein
VFVPIKRLSFLRHRAFDSCANTEQEFDSCLKEPSLGKLCPSGGSGNCCFLECDTVQAGKVLEEPAACVSCVHLS